MNILKSVFPFAFNPDHIPSKSNALYGRDPGLSQQQFDQSLSKLKSEVDSHHPQQNEDDLLKLTEDCMNNISNLLLVRLLDKTQAELNKKLEWLQENVSTHPQYMSELKSTNEQLLKLEKEVTLNSSNTAKFNELKAKVRLMREQFDMVFKEIIAQIEEIKFDLRKSKISALFQMDNLKYLKHLIDSSKQSIRQVIADSVKYTLKVNFRSLSNSTFSPLDLCQLLPLTQSISSSEGYHLTAAFETYKEYDLAVQILEIALDPFKITQATIQDTNPSLLSKFICRKRDAKYERKRLEHTVLKQVKQMVGILDQESDIDRKIKASTTKGRGKKKQRAKEAEKENDVPMVFREVSNVAYEKADQANRFGGSGRKKWKKENN